MDYNYKKREDKYLSLNAKINIAKIVIKDALDNFTRPAVVWSAGKDSTVVLDLVRKVTKVDGIDMPPAILIDHGQHYDETYKMVEDMSKKWGFKVIYARNEDFLSKVNDNKVNVDDLNEDNQEELRKINFNFNKKYIDYSIKDV